MVVAATTVTYAIFRVKTWYGPEQTQTLGDVSLAMCWCIALSMFLLISFFRVQSGALYPSDCLFSLVPILVIIAVTELIKVSSGGLLECPVCGTQDTICYFD